MMKKFLLIVSVTFPLLLAGCGASKNYVQTNGSDDSVNTGYTKSSKKASITTLNFFIDINLLTDILSVHKIISNG